jgi:membrane-bound lytic murein transglycosylase F
MRACLLILFAVLAAGCSPDPAPRAARPAQVGDYRSGGELRVATRMDAISYRADEDGTISGFEHDVLLALGEHLQVPVRFDVYPDAIKAMDAVLNGHAHIAAAGLARNERLPLRWSSALREVDYILVRRENRAPIAEEKDLAGRTVGVRRGTLAADALEAIRRRQPLLKISLAARGGDQALLEQVARGELDLAATDRVHFALASGIHPDLALAYDLPIRATIAWAMPERAAGGLAKQIEDFLAAARRKGLLARLADRYFGHYRRLDDADVAAFTDDIRKRLPGFRRDFEEAERRTGLDWRYLAALAYQESRWDPLATSYTGVRGMMMLTSETADRLGVADRLDARESILGGAHYLARLKDDLPDEIAEPDRSWMATAAYNLGMGHLNGARRIAQSLQRDNTSWFEMKRVLPLMSKPEFAARLKAGPARGGEAVITTEKVRAYFDILARLEPPFVDVPDRAASAGGKPAGRRGNRAGGLRPPEGALLSGETR